MNLNLFLQYSYDTNVTYLSSGLNSETLLYLPLALYTDGCIIMKYACIYHNLSNMRIAMI